MVAHASSQTMRMHYSWNPIFFSHVQASTHALELNCRAAKMCPLINQLTETQYISNCLGNHFQIIVSVILQAKMSTLAGSSS